MVLRCVERKLSTFCLVKQEYKDVVKEAHQEYWKVEALYHFSYVYLWRRMVTAGCGWPHAGDYKFCNGVRLSVQTAQCISFAPPARQPCHVSLGSRCQRLFHSLCQHGSET